MKKRLLAIALAAFMAISVTACSDGGAETETTTEEVVETVETITPDSGTDTTIKNEDIIEINLFDGTDDING